MLNLISNWSEEVFVISKIKKKVPWTYVINDLSGEETAGTFYEKELQKTNQEEFRIEKVIKRKGKKLHVKWKDYDDFLNSWIDTSKLSKLAAKSHLASLKAEVGKIGPEKLKAVSVDLNKLNNVVNNEVVKKTVYVNWF